MCDNRIFGRGVRGTCLGWGSGRAFSYRVPGASQPGWARCRKRGQHRGVKSSPSMSHRPLWGTRRPSANVHYWGGKRTLGYDHRFADEPPIPKVEVPSSPDRVCSFRRKKDERHRTAFLARLQRLTQDRPPRVSEKRSSWTDHARTSIARPYCDLLTSLICGIELKIGD